MGDFNSSVTRVWPVFDHLLNADPTGSSCLPSLLALGSRTSLVGRDTLLNPGPLLPRLSRFDRKLPAPIARALGPDRAMRTSTGQRVTQI